MSNFEIGVLFVMVSFILICLATLLIITICIASDLDTIKKTITKENNNE